MNSISIKVVLITAICFFLNACSYVPSLGDVLPDKRKDYQKSESMPDLEIPPDLTADAINDSMSIPNEQQTATLSNYQNPPVATNKSVQTGTTSSDEQWLSLTGTTVEIWPKLREFFTTRGYNMELDDADLGVLVTGWSEPVQTGGFVYRNKYKVFSEPGTDDNVTVVFVNNQRQERIGSPGSESWLDTEKDKDAERLLAGELNAFFSSAAPVAITTPTQTTSPVTTTQTQQPARPPAEIMDIGDGKLYLVIPDEFTRAWRQTGIVMQQAGLQVTETDQDKGLYSINFFPSPEQQEEGFFSKLAFWKDDEPQATPYKLSLTGVGNKTELIVLNEEGDWDTSENSREILDLLQQRYNSL